MDEWMLERMKKKTKRQLQLNLKECKSDWVRERKRERVSDFVTRKQFMDHVLCTQAYLMLQYIFFFLLLQIVMVVFFFLCKLFRFVVFYFHFCFEVEKKYSKKKILLFVEMKEKCDVKMNLEHTHTFTCLQTHAIQYI